MSRCTTLKTLVAIAIACPVPLQARQSFAFVVSTLPSLRYSTVVRRRSITSIPTKGDTDSNSFHDSSSAASLLMADTTDALATLKAQLDDMLLNNSTRATYCLASPANRRQTARGGYDQNAFDAMVRSPTYSPLLSKGSGIYEVLSHRQTGQEFQASVCVIQVEGSSNVFNFVMSLQQPDVVDEDPSLDPYQLRPGHLPMWRTNSVMRSRR
jgi:hypothetical protein